MSYAVNVHFICSGRISAMNVKAPFVLGFGFEINAFFFFFKTIDVVLGEA